MKINNYLAVAALAALGLTAGCSSSGETSPGAKGHTQIAMVVHGAAGDAFWSDVKSGAQDAAKLTGASLDYQSSGDLKEQA